MPRDSYWTICPYCEHRHTDAIEPDQSESRQDVECDDCGKTFVAHAECSVDYITMTLEESMSL